MSSGCAAHPVTADMKSPFFFQVVSHMTQDVEQAFATAQFNVSSSTFCPSFAPSFSFLFCFSFFLFLFLFSARQWAFESRKVVSHSTDLTNSMTDEL